MRIRFLLINILLDKFFRGLQSIISFLTFALEGHFALDFVLDGSLVSLSFLHDVRQDILLSEYEIDLTPVRYSLLIKDYYTYLKYYCSYTPFLIHRLSLWLCDLHTKVFASRMHINFISRFKNK